MQIGLATITEEEQNGFSSLRNDENPNCTPVDGVEKPESTSGLSVGKPICTSLFELSWLEVMKMIVQIGFPNENYEMQFGLAMIM